MAHLLTKQFLPLHIAVLTISDSRTLATDTSGQVLIDSLQAAGHQLAGRALVADDIWQIRAQASQWIADAQVQVILLTGGTGFTERDNTPQAVAPLLDKQVDGFGELFRLLSLEEIGTSSLQSRALAGISNGTLICCLPGSPNACRTGWNKILKEQLDSRTGPCNFVAHLRQTNNQPAAACASRA